MTGWIWILPDNKYEAIYCALVHADSKEHIRVVGEYMTERDAQEALYSKGIREFVVLDKRKGEKCGNKIRKRKQRA